eukprot:2171263-Amphidinium_carterae.1
MCLQLPLHDHDPKGTPDIDAKIKGGNLNSSKLLEYHLHLARTSSQMPTTKHFCLFSTAPFQPR